MARSLAFAALALLAPLAAQASEPTPFARDVEARCLAESRPATECGARAEIEDASRCALNSMRVATAGDDEPMPDPSRVVSDRKEALRLLSEGEPDEALVVAGGLRAMFAASCASTVP